MYNTKLIETLVARFTEIATKLDTIGTGDSSKTDLYPFIASILYNKPYEDCCEIRPDGSANPDGKEFRNRAKQFVLPVVTECGGIFDDTEDIKKMIDEHKNQAVHLRDCVHASEDSMDSPNNLELLDQAVDCDLIAGWLEELLLFRGEI